VLNKAGRSVTELASENGQADAAKFISDYKANTILEATVLDTFEYVAVLRKSTLATQTRTGGKTWSKIAMTVMYLCRTLCRYLIQTFNGSLPTKRA
jgi:hypothetical protein